MKNVELISVEFIIVRVEKDHKRNNQIEAFRKIVSFKEMLDVWNILLWLVILMNALES